MTRMSEKMIAASKLKRRIGCSVTSAAYSGVKQRSRKAAGLGAQFAIFGQIAAGLPHHPDRRHLLPVPGKHFEERFGSEILGQEWFLRHQADIWSLPDTRRASAWPRRNWNRPPIRAALSLRNGGTAMAEKFNPAPHDKHAADPRKKRSPPTGRCTRSWRPAWIDTFPASDPVSAAQPAPSKHDAIANVLTARRSSGTR